MNQEKVQELEKKAFENALYYTGISLEKGKLIIQKIYAIYKNQGFDAVKINDEGLQRFNEDKLKYVEMITSVNLEEKENKYTKRLTKQEFLFFQEYIKFGNYLMQKGQENKKEVHPKETSAYIRLCKNIIGQQEMKETLCKLGAVYQYAKKREKYHFTNLPIHKVLAFIGPPGTAKTTSAMYFAEMMKEEGILTGEKLVSITGTQLKAKYVGQTSERVHQIFQNHDIIIIDEAYSLVNYHETDRTDSFSQEALAQLCIEVEEHSQDKLIIFAGYGGDISDKDNKMKKFMDENPGISSRITFTVYFSSYRAEEMLEIFRLLAENANYSLEEGWKEILLPFFEKRINAENFGNGREARRLLEHAMAVSALHFMDWCALTGEMNLEQREEEEKYRLSILSVQDLSTAVEEFQRKN